jgi:hypothetical protein
LQGLFGSPWAFARVQIGSRISQLFKEKKLAFPKNFLWVGAIAAHQAEEACREGGKGISTCDVYTAARGGLPKYLTQRQSVRISKSLNKKKQKYQEIQPERYLFYGSINNVNNLSLTR